MAEMVEKVAKVLAHIERVEVDDEHRLMARAAIEAMREPTPNMDMAADDAVGALTMGDLAEGDSENIVIFRAMIDAALA